MKRINIACLQFASTPFANEMNLDRAEAMIREAAKNGATICILPEVFNPGYSHDERSFLQAETLDGPTITRLKALAAELMTYITGGLTEKAGNEFFNTMFFIGPSGLLAVYHKQHVFSLENKYWKRGKGIKIVTVPGVGDIGLGICADMHDPEIWHQYAGNVDLVLVCSAWPGPPEKTHTRYGDHEAELCRDLPVQISRAMQVPVAHCNASHDCTGKVALLGRLYCQGNSKIVDNGIVVVSIDSREERVVQADVELADSRREVDPGAFKPWITHTASENFLRFFVEGLGMVYGRLYYARTKRKYR
jgi:predicted amidohydrolase